METENQYFFISALFLIVGCSTTTSYNPEPVALFAENSSDWFMDGGAVWSFSDGELIGRADSIPGYVVTKSSFKNFELNLEFMPDSAINSGVFVRCIEGGTTATNCYEPEPDFKTRLIVEFGQVDT